MCGFAGLVDLAASTPQAELQKAADGMAARLRHRGPDDAGGWADERVGIALSFRRLAILDLSGRGAQPMRSSCGRYVVVFNGELYNAPELRRELEGAGRSFRGHSDTEVLVEAISAWGLRRVLCRADAMLSVAVWDREDRVLRVARDRFGEKPLYRGSAGRVVLFASELTALRAHPAFHAEIDPLSSALALRYGHVPSPHAALRGVSKLPPGTIGTLRPDGSWEDEQYWSAAEVAVHGVEHRVLRSAAAAADELEVLLRASLAKRSHSDVPVGAFLSGGVDSACLVALLQQQGSRPVRTYTIGFGSAAHDEAAHARAVAAALGTEHTEHYVSDGEVAALAPDMAGIYDEPFADSSQIPTTLVARLARRDVTVAFAGDGADEVFGGYTRHVAQQRAAMLERVPRPLRVGLGRALAAVPATAWESLARAVPASRRPRHVADKAAKAVAVLGAHDAVAVHDLLLRAPLAERAHELRGQASAARPLLPAGLSRAGTSAEALLWLDTITYLPDDILTKVDRATMSVSLEARLPYLDPALYAFAWSLPPELRVSGGTGKRVLRDVLHRHVPRALVDRPKTGFAAPLAGWLRGPLRGWGEELLADAALARTAHVRREVGLTLWAQHQSGAADHSRDLWHVLSLLAWADTLGPR